MGTKMRNAILFAAGAAAFSLGAYFVAPGSVLAAGPASQPITFTNKLVDFARGCTHWPLDNRFQRLYITRCDAAKEVLVLHRRGPSRSAEAD